jgi:hypothetical protein
VVEIGIQSSFEPVNAYIKSKLSELERGNGYTLDVLDEM